jgi:hypothetical protein
MPKKSKLAKPDFMSEFNNILIKYNSTPVTTEKLFAFFTEDELIPMIKTLQYYYRANPTLHKQSSNRPGVVKYEKPYILTILKIVYVLMNTKVGGDLTDIVEYDSGDEYGDGYELDEYRGRKNRLGQLFMLMTVGIVIFIYWMLFQQLVKDVNSLENSLEMISSTQDRIVDILVRSVENSFNELDMKLSQSNILVSLDEDVSLPSFMEFSSQELAYEPLAIGDGTPVDSLQAISASMYDQYKHILALKTGIISAIYGGWSYNERPVETTLEFTGTVGKQFMKQSTEIVSRVIQEKSDEMGSLSVKYMNAIKSKITEEYRQDKIIELLSTFVGAQVATNAHAMIMEEINSIMTEEMLYFMTNTNTQVQNRVSTDMRIYLDRVKRYTKSIYNILWCIQRVTYIAFILPIMNKYKRQIVEVVDRQMNGSLLALEDRGGIKKKPSKKNKKSTKKSKKKKKGYTHKKK